MFIQTLSIIDTEQQEGQDSTFRNLENRSTQTSVTPSRVEQQSMGIKTEISIKI